MKLLLHMEWLTPFNPKADFHKFREPVLVPTACHIHQHRGALRLFLRLRLRSRLHLIMPFIYGYMKLLIP